MPMTFAAGAGAGDSKPWAVKARRLLDIAARALPATVMGTGVTNAAQTGHRQRNDGDRAHADQRRLCGGGDARRIAGG